MVSRPKVLGTPNYFLMTLRIVKIWPKPSIVFLLFLPAHFDPLPPDDNMASLEVPSEHLVDTQQVYKKLREIKTTKSPGPDMLPNKILRIFACELAPIYHGHIQLIYDAKCLPEGLEKIYSS